MRDRRPRAPRPRPAPRLLPPRGDLSWRGFGPRAFAPGDARLPFDLVMQVLAWKTIGSGRSRDLARRERFGTDARPRPRATPHVGGSAIRRGAASARARRTTRRVPRGSHLRPAAARPFGLRPPPRRLPLRRNVSPREIGTQAFAPGDARSPWESLVTQVRYLEDDRQREQWRRARGG
jgi:hypothetical protein